MPLGNQPCKLEANAALTAKPLGGSFFFFSLFSGVDRAIQHEHRASLQLFFLFSFFLFLRGDVSLMNSGVAANC